MAEKEKRRIKNGNTPFKYRTGKSRGFSELMPHLFIFIICHP